MGTPKGDETEREIAVLKEDLEKLLDYATELNAGRKEISAIATLIVLCRMV